MHFLVVFANVAFYLRVDASKKSEKKENNKYEYFICFRNSFSVSFDFQKHFSLLPADAT